MRPQIGDERYLLEIIETERVEAMARKDGWNGDDSLREYSRTRRCCSPQVVLILKTKQLPPRKNRWLPAEASTAAPSLTVRCSKFGMTTGATV